MKKGTDNFRYYRTWHIVSMGLVLMLLYSTPSTQGRTLAPLLRTS